MADRKRNSPGQPKASFRAVSLRGRWSFPTVRESQEPLRKRLAAMPRGKQQFWGIPFELAPEGRRMHVVALAASRPQVLVPLSGRATHVCLVHFWEGPPDPSRGDAGGEPVAEYVLRFADGAEAPLPIRTRFEIGWGNHSWGQQLFGAVSFNGIRSMNFDTADARRQHEWGYLQCDVAGGGTGEPWVYALVNPHPQKRLSGILLRGTHASPAGVLAITLYNGPGHPLRHLPRRYYLVEVRQPGASVTGASTDLGVLVRPPMPVLPRGRDWLRAPTRGLGVEAAKPSPSSQAVLQISGAEGATVRVQAQDLGKRKKEFALSLGEAFGAGQSSDGAATLEVVHPRRTWLHVTVRDAQTGKPTPTRIHFSGPHGEYYPPHGHHEVINANWFEDYGADVQLGGMNYAYVHGRFQTELPVGEVYVEIVKGFEYEPVRQKVRIRPGQRELELSIRRAADLRREGWVTADTHVHFISPHTAWLQGQGEGVNLINLLASQWGRLFTNVGDLTGEPGVEKDDTIVWVGTENRNHILGHISLLGTHGDPVFPLCTGGPAEAYVGDPDSLALAEWADENRARKGVVIRPHFPAPNLENPVQIVLGKLDAVELRRFGNGAVTLDHDVFSEWYRYLNCGYRVAAAGGTDKMSAGMPVGGVRTYALLDRNRPFHFDNWAAAVRGGRTFTTSGPLIDLSVDGHSIGDVISLKGGRGRVEMMAHASCVWPIHRLQIVVNGQVVAEALDAKGCHRLELRHKMDLPGSCWIAARCGSSLLQHHCWPIHLGAHTSPIYVTAPGSDLFSPSEATYMLTLIDGGLTYLDTLSVRFDRERSRRIQALYREAQDHLRRRIQAHERL